MYQVYNLNKISEKGTALWTENYQTIDNVDDAEAILVRSAAMHEMAFSKKLLAVARAGAGVNNIPLDRCAEDGIVVFNTPGANANGVMELALCGMLLGSRDVIGGINWVQANKDAGDIAKKVEKEKSKFAGNEIASKKLGVIGLGAIGGPLANAARKLGMEVYGCDPYISIDAEFVKAAESAGFVNLKGHRTVGGMRASIYNAMPIEGVEKLVAFMKDFESKR